MKNQVNIFKITFDVSKEVDRTTVAFDNPSRARD